jgi:hypothetical protein
MDDLVSLKSFIYASLVDYYKIKRTEYVKGKIDGLGKVLMLICDIENGQYDNIESFSTFDLNLQVD